MSENVRFDPWNLGENVSLDGVRLLVVAESHYKEPGCTEQFTPAETDKIVRANAPPFAVAPSNSLFAKIADAFASDAVHRDEVWKRIYYCNYFQRPFETPGEKPRPSDFEESAPHFDHVLRTIRPDAVVVMSSRLWHGMANEAAPDPAYDGANGLGRAYRFTGGADLRIPAARTWHPSAPRHFRVEHWKPRIAHFLKWVKASDLPAGNS